MKKLILFLVFMLSSFSFADCSLQINQYHEGDNYGCSIIVVNENDCYNDTWVTNDLIFINETTAFYNETSVIGSLSTYNYYFGLSSLECNNGTNFYYNYSCLTNFFNDSIYYANLSAGPYGLSGICVTTTTTTTTEATTTTEETTTTTEAATTTTEETTTTAAPSTTPGTTLYGYSIPNGNYGTLPSLNGTGGNTTNNGTLKNMPCTGFCIIGLNKDEFELYAAIFITVLVLLAVKPFKLGATASAIALSFFNYILGWTAFTGSLCLLFIVIAVSAWFTEDK